MKTNLILDANNLIYRSFFAHQNEDEETTTGLCYNMALVTMNKFYREYNAVDIVVAFDMPKASWRKLYTKEDCVTKKLYKGHRRDGMTVSQIAKLNKLNENIDELSTIFKNKTGIITLKRQYLEADDLIAGFVQKFPDDKHIIITSDKDYIQLLSNGNVTVVDPMSGKARDLIEWDHDANYFMFEKCIRGDAGDNVQSSYPRLPSKKIKIAYTDDLVRTNIMNHVFDVEYLKNEELLKHTYCTKDLFEENQLLMDLTKQPEYIRDLMDETINEAIANRGVYKHLDFIRFCGKFDLQNVLNNINQYSALLSGKGKSNIY